MSEKRSLAYQRNAIEHLIALCPDAGDTIIDAAKQACLSLGWFERRTELAREMVRLEKDAPELAALLHQIKMPDTRLVDIRFYDEAAE